jgi:NAD(P)-dependent dehydrogenase (short-subunit alcohol dehydrogenase family)
MAHPDAADARERTVFNPIERLVRRLNGRFHSHIRWKDRRRSTVGKLDGKVAVVTGATSGMALATAQRFVAEGADVFITGERRQELERAIGAIGGSVVGVQGDPARLADVDRLYQRVREAHGRIDVLCANDGIGEFTSLAEVTEEHFDRTFAANLRGTLFTVHRAMPLLSDGASIIMTGSIASIPAFERFDGYTASRAALRSFARAWMADLKERNIRVNVLSPGEAAGQGSSTIVPRDVKDRFAALVPREATGPVKIARAALFLASSDSSPVSGIELFVDGRSAHI